MRVTAFLSLFALLELAAGAGGYEKILLSNVKSLTLRDGQLTKARRLSPIPQLKCIGGDARDLYNVDVMRCKNLGSDYDDEDSISWSCTADLPIYFKLGSTDVLCEGYSTPDDRYILKGSCGVEYRLSLTDAGYEKYGSGFQKDNFGTRNANDSDTASTIIFGLIFVSVLAWIIYSAWSQHRRPRLGPSQRPVFFNDDRPWFGGGGGGDDPPPPYGPRPPFSKTTAPQSGVWTPGFGAGLAAGAAGATLWNSMRGRGQQERERPVERSSRTSRSDMGSWGDSDFGEGSSMDAARHSSTGFGQTRRR